MFKYALLPFLLIPAWSQTTPPVTPPAPPECLTRPVTQGTVTIKCSLMDYSQPNHASDQSVLFSAASGYIFQVSASSSDPTVIAVRIGVSVGPTADKMAGWGVTGASAPVGYPDPAAPGVQPAVFRYTFYVGSAAITSIQVQELKASSSQTF